MTQRKVILPILRLHVLQVRGIERNLLQLPEKKASCGKRSLIKIAIFHHCASLHYIKIKLH